MKSLLFLPALLILPGVLADNAVTTTTAAAASSSDAAVSLALQLHPQRFLLHLADAESINAEHPATFVDPSRELMTEVAGLAAAHHRHHADHRNLQFGNDTLTFDDVCNFLVTIINEGSDNAIICNCTADTNTLGCLTPTPICENTFTNICASLSLEMSFLDNFGASSLQVCVNYTGVSDPSGPFRDGCVGADFSEDGTTIDTCTATFDDASGVPTNCTTCTGCGNVTTGAGFSLDCSNLYPGATTNGCYTTGATADRAAALFPAADSSFEGGSSNNGTGTTDGGSSSGSNSTNGTIYSDDSDGDMEDDNGSSSNNSTGTGTGSSPSGASGTSAAPAALPGRTLFAAVTAGGSTVAMASTIFVMMGWM